MKIIDRPISQDDVGYQLRNLKSLNCLYDSSMVIRYFGKDFISRIEKLLAGLSSNNEASRAFLESQESTLHQIRQFFKLMRYTEDQKNKLTKDLEKLVRESTRENKCGGSILYKETLKTNFKILLELELYFRARYGGQLSTTKNNFEAIRNSIDLFVESLDKQFTHEYYW